MGSGRCAPSARRLGWALVCALGLHASAADAQERYTVFRVGADLGVSRIAGEQWWQVNATGLLRLGPFRTDFYVPLRFGMADFHFREADYQQARDFLRVVQCTRLDLGDYTRPEDRHDPECDPYRWTGRNDERTYLSLRVSPLRSLSLGHGSLVTDFNNSLDPNRPQLGAQLDAQLHMLAAARAFVDDVVSPRVLAANLLLRPPQAIGREWDRTPEDFVVRAGVVTDLAAPLRVRSAFGQPVRDAEGNVQMTTARLTAVTADTHFTWFWFPDESDDGTTREIGLQGFADYNRFLEVEDADGLHMGLRFRYRMRGTFNRVDGREAREPFTAETWELDAGGEYRNMGNRYLPGYFDSNYDVQSQQFATNNQARSLLGVDALTTSKLEYLLSQPLGRSQGFQAYLRFVIPVPTASGEPPSRMPITLWAEDATGPLRTSVSASVGPFRLDQLIVGAQVQRRNFDGWSNLFSLDGTLIRVLGAVFLSSSQARRENDSLLNNLVVNFAYTRRFLRESNGDLSTANDFLVTLGSSLGVQ